MNFQDIEAFQQFHDKPLRLDPSDMRAPLPGLFFYHEGLCWAKKAPGNAFPPPTITQRVVSRTPDVIRGSSSSSGQDMDGDSYEDETAHTIRHPQESVSNCQYVMFDRASRDTSPTSDDGIGGESCTLRPFPLVPIKDPTKFFSPENMGRFGYRNWLDEDLVDDEGRPHRWNNTTSENMNIWKSMCT